MEQKPLLLNLFEKFLVLNLFEKSSSKKRTRYCEIDATITTANSLDNTAESNLLLCCCDYPILTCNWIMKWLIPLNAVRCLNQNHEMVNFAEWSYLPKAFAAGGLTPGNNILFIHFNLAQSVFNSWKNFQIPLKAYITN